MSLLRTWSAQIFGGTNALVPWCVNAMGEFWRFKKKSSREGVLQLWGVRVESLGLCVCVWGVYLCVCVEQKALIPEILQKAGEEVLKVIQ